MHQLGPEHGACIHPFHNSCYSFPGRPLTIPADKESFTPYFPSPITGKWRKSVGNNCKVITRSEWFCVLTCLPFVHEKKTTKAKLNFHYEMNKNPIVSLRSHWFQKRAKTPLSDCFRMCDGLWCSCDKTHQQTESLGFSRRHNQQYLVPHCKTKFHQNSFFISTAKLWNGLPTGSSLLEGPPVAG